MSRFDFPLLDRIADMVARHLPGAATLVDEREAARARTMIGGMPQSSLVRIVVDRLLHGFAPSAADIRPVLNVLLDPSGFKWRERFLVAWAMGYAALEPQERAYASDWLIEVVRDHMGADTGGRWLRAVLRAMIPAAVIGGLSLIGLGPIAIFVFVAATLGLTPISAPFSFRLDAQRRNSVRAAAVRSLGRLAMPRALPTVAAALHDAGLGRRAGRPEVRHAAQEALPALARNVREEDRPGIAAEADPLLCRALSHPDDVVVYHAMYALSFLGSERTLKTLQSIAKRGRTPSIKEAARQDAARLQEVLVRAHAAETLLRPADAPGTDPALLLRPVEDAGPTDSALLLRPSSYEEAP